MLLVILGALTIGLTLGLLGSGGSILTVPVLVYLVGHSGKPAVAESLAIVGAISTIGAWRFQRQGQVDWWNVALFGVPATAGTYLGAAAGQYVADAWQLILNAMFMMLAAVLMYRNGCQPEKPTATVTATPRRQAYYWIVLEGLVVGAITGLVGVGGGSLIIPALVLLGGLPMRLAVGTSLVIIAIKSYVGFFKYHHELDPLTQAIDWTTIGSFAAVGIVGTLIGEALSQRLPQNFLKRAFAIMLIPMSIFVLAQEIPKLRMASTAEPPVAPADLPQAAPDVNDH